MRFRPPQLTLDVEGVLHLAGRVLLGNEHGVEVPEGRLDEVVGGHLGEAEVEEDLAELLAHLEKRMQCAAVGRLSLRGKVVLLELGVLPLAGSEHVRAQVRLEHLDLGRELGTLGDAEVELFPRNHKLALHQLLDHLVAAGVAARRLHLAQLVGSLVDRRVC